MQIGENMVVISSAVATVSDKVTYSLMSLALATSQESVAGSASQSFYQFTRHQSSDQFMASYGSGRSRRASFTVIPFARRRHYAVRRKRRLSSSRR